jgi:hypothetical protein
LPETVVTWHSLVTHPPSTEIGATLPAALVSVSWSVAGAAGRCGQADDSPPTSVSSATVMPATWVKHTSSPVKFGPYRFSALCGL